MTAPDPNEHLTDERFGAAYLNIGGTPGEPLSRPLTPAERAQYAAAAHEAARLAEIASRPDCPNCGRPGMPDVCPACCARAECYRCGSADCNCSERGLEPVSATRRERDDACENEACCNEAPCADCTEETAREASGILNEVPAEDELELRRRLPTTAPSAAEQMYGVCPGCGQDHYGPCYPTARAALRVPALAVAGAMLAYDGEARYLAACAECEHGIDTALPCAECAVLSGAWRFTDTGEMERVPVHAACLMCGREEPGRVCPGCGTEVLS